ncbi:MAG TPA: hypothetical protein VM240_02960 [Verrucomicrobiae bacterium]|nr:hypothetical protein [Verrucomicrobiae bacterium]
MRFFPVLALMVSVALLPRAADARSREERQSGDARRVEQREQQDSQRSPDRDHGREHRNDGSAAAAREAQQRNGGGRVLSVEPDGGGYRVKVLKDGEVRTHRVEG